MKRYTIAGIVLLVIGAVLVLTFLPNSSILPFFTGPGCSEADVLVYDGDYNTITGEITLFAKNNGKTNLQLEPFITSSTGTVTKSDKLLYLSIGKEGVFTIENIDSEPKEVTLRDKKCAVADLWKF